ncbi:MAG: hypothetical protein JWO30_3137 [Fibrobacteres bacterium]|nr:hypothetical protein [Fibrobacterota bacterium]
MVSPSRPLRSATLLPLFLICLVSLSHGGGNLPAKALVADKDTVLGIDKQHWDDLGEWKPANRIQIRNASPEAVIIDSVRQRVDTLSYGSQMEMVFSWREKEGEPTRPVLNGDKIPIRIPAGDSLELGMFEIGDLGILVKQSAQARKYPIDDSIATTITVHFGRDSLQFVLKAKVKMFSFGSAVRKRDPVLRRRNAPIGCGADGRQVSKTGRSAHGRAFF